MTARRIITLKFIIYFCRRIEHALQLKGTDQRRRTVNFVKISDFFRNFNKAVRRVHFLSAKLVAENRTELLLAKRLIRSRIQIRIRLFLHIRRNVIPISGNLFLGKINFLDYLEHQAQRYEEAGSRAYARTVRNTIIHLTRYAGENITIGHVDKKYLSGFIDYLNGASSKYYHTDKEGTTRRRTLSQASRALYFNAVVIALNRAVKDDIIPSNPAHKIPEADRPKEGQATKEYLTLDEVQKLEATPCKYPELKRAFLFSCFCGLRMSDVRRLRWQDIHTTADGQKQVETVQQKTGEPIYIPLSNNALRYLPDDSRSTEQDRIFILPHVSTIEKYLSVWGKNAGITKHLTYHVSRHTNATLMLTYGADIYTVSKLLGHTNVKTTAVYAKIVDENKRKAVNLIPDIKTQGMEG